MSDVFDPIRRYQSFLRVQVGKPYFYGAEGPDEWDCSGLYRRACTAGDFWPIDGDAGVARIWTGPEFVRIEGSDPEPGDAIVYGPNGQPAHLVCVLSPTELVGANSGSPPRDGESEEEYRARMKANGARVKITSHGYWLSARLGIVRPRTLIDG